MTSAVGGAASQQQKFANLRRRLDQLGYKQPLGVESLPLVERIFADLVHTTESLKNAKLQLSRVDHSPGTSPVVVDSQVEPYKNENARLVKENTELHLQLVQLKEEYDTKLSDVKATLRRLEHENNDLRFLNNQYVHKVRIMERESLEKTEKILRLQEKNFQAVVQTPGGKTKGVPFRRQRLVMDCALPPASAAATAAGKVPAIPPREDPLVANLLSIADDRIAQLQAENRRYINENEILENKGQNFRKQLETRDAEIDRLGRMLDGGRPYDVVALESRSRSNEKLIAHLNIQVDYLQQKNRELERRLDEAVAVETEARRQAANADLKKSELEVELKDVDRMAKRLQIDKDTVVNVADKELMEAKVELEKSRKELDNLDLEVAQLKAERRRLDEDNASLLTKLAARDADVQRLNDLIDRVQADKKRLSQRISQLVGSEKELVLEIDHLKQKKGAVRRGKSPNRFDTFIKGIEMERDYWKQEVETLQEVLRHRGSTISRGRSGERPFATQSRSSSGVRSPPEGHRPSALIASEDERSFRDQDSKLRSAFLSSAASPSRRSARAGDSCGLEASAELRRVRKERDELQAVLDKFERHMSEIQANVKVLTAERDRLGTQYAEARDELQRLRHDLLRSPKSAKTSLAAQAVLRRVESERDDALGELRRAVVERDTLRERLKVATETLIGDRARFERRVEELQMQLEQVLLERDELDGSVTGLKNRIEQLEEEVRIQLRRYDDAVADGAQQKASATHLRVMADETERSLREHQQRLQAKDVELRSAEERCRALDDRILELQKTCQTYRDDTALLKANLHGLDREKDELQAAVDDRAERCAALDDELSRRERDLDEARERARELERRLEHGDETMALRERELKSLRKQLDAAGAEVGEAAQARDSALRETRRSHDDLATMTRENQALHAELQECEDERERLTDQVRDYVAEVKHVEQLLATKEEERSQLLAQYRLVSMEAERQGSQYTRLESESSGMRRELAARDADLRRLRDQNATLEGDVQEYVHGQQALEGQIATLQRTVAGLEERLHDVDADRQGLQQDVMAARDLCAKVEVGRDQMQRAATSRSVELEQMQRVIDDLRQEASALRSQLAGERQSAKGLETLLVSTREKEFKVQMSRQEMESEVQLMRDRLTLNETKIESQAREIAHLRTRNSELENEVDKQRRQLTNERYERERAVQEAHRLSATSLAPLTSSGSRLGTSGRDSPTAGHRSVGSGSPSASSPSKYAATAGGLSELRQPSGAAGSPSKIGTSSSSSSGEVSLSGSRPRTSSQPDLAAARAAAASSGK